MRNHIIHQVCLCHPRVAAVFLLPQIQLNRRQDGSLLSIANNALIKVEQSELVIRTTDCLRPLRLQ